MIRLISHWEFVLFSRTMGCWMWSEVWQFEARGLSWENCLTFVSQKIQGYDHEDTRKEYDARASHRTFKCLQLQPALLIHVYTVRTFRVTSFVSWVENLINIWANSSAHCTPEFDVISRRSVIQNSGKQILKPKCKWSSFSQLFSEVCFSAL